MKSGTLNMGLSSLQQAHSAFQAPPEGVLDPARDGGASFMSKARELVDKVLTIAPRGKSAKGARGRKPPEIRPKARPSIGSCLNRSCTIEVKSSEFLRVDVVDQHQHAATERNTRVVVQGTLALRFHRFRLMFRGRRDPPTLLREKKHAQ